MALTTAIIYVKSGCVLNAKQILGINRARETAKDSFKGT